MEIDLLDPHVYETDPFPMYRWLRENEPIFHDEKNEIWVASKHEDCLFILRNPQIFSSAKGVLPDSENSISLITMDDPRHGQLRKLISRGFSPRMVGRLEPRIDTITRELIDAIADKGECEFVRDLAIPLPMRIIAELIGISEGHMDKFREWSDTMIYAAGQQNNPEVVTAATLAYGEYAAYLKRLFAERRENPREDLVSILLNATDEGHLEEQQEIRNLENQDELPDDELILFMVLLLVAGNETTRNAISGGMNALLQYPEQKEKLMARPDLIDSAVDEIIRWVSPIIGFARTLTQDFELRGKKLCKGEKIWMIFQSANRDPDVFENPDEFNIERNPNNHLAFGNGAHYCLGANLARLEVKTMLQAVFKRLPDIALAEGTQPRHIGTAFVRAVEWLPVTFSPEDPS